MKYQPLDKILITGANGFVGRALSAFLSHRGHTVKEAVRRIQQAGAAPSANTVAVGDIGAGTDWSKALEDVEAVVHLAARVHVMKDDAVDPLAAFRAVNVHGTEHLARVAAEAGIRRFVYVSSIKVNGEATKGMPFRTSDKPEPLDAYGVSKWEAEQALHKLAADTGLEVAILRPPLVYGPGVGANFLRLMTMAAKGLPMPLSAIDNRRSLLYVTNLCSAIAACLEDPAAAGQTFLVSDGEDISTADLIRRLAQLLHGSDRLWPLPLPLLRALGTLTGKSAEISRLTESLTIDSSDLRRKLGWQPPVSLGQGLAETAAWFLASNGANS